MSDTRALLDALPAASTLAAVVDFKLPMAPGASIVDEVAEPLAFFLEPVLKASDRNGVAFANPFAFSWPARSLRDLKPWAQRLRAHDERNLFGFTVSKVRTIAAHPQVYAAIYERISPAELAVFTTRPEVAHITVLDAALETDPQRSQQRRLVDLDR
jgi:hypothetical protein